MRFHQYADDTQLYFSTKARLEMLWKPIQNPNAMGVWMCSNKLQLNPNKKELLFIKKSYGSLLQFDLWMGGTSLKKQVHNLRALLNSLVMLVLLVKTLVGRLLSSTSIGTPVTALSTMEGPDNSSCLSSLDY